MYAEEEQKKKDLLTPQAQIFAIAFLLFIANMFILMIGMNKFDAKILINVFFIIVTFVISTYVINCTVVGQCHIYAWIVAYAVLVLSIVSVANSIYVISKI